MARRYRSRTSLETFVSRISAILFLGVVAQLLSARGNASFPAWFWAATVFVAELCIVFVIYRAYQTHRLRRAGMPEIDAMSGEHFEEYLVTLFQALGYSVDHFSQSHRGNEYGIDLVLTKDNQKTAVQAKRYMFKQHVDNTAVEKLVAAKAMFNCDHALIVTNSSFTANARYAANKLNVELWGRKELADAILQSQSSGPQTP